MQDNSKASPPPPLSDFIGTAIAEWHKRYAEYVGGKPQGDAAEVLGALAETAGAIIARLPTRLERRKARVGFEARFRRTHAAMGK